MSKVKEIFNYLYKLGTCKACCLRYICLRTQAVYENIDTYIREKEFLCAKNETIDTTNSDELTGSGENTICIVCLGLLQDFCMNDIVKNIANNENIRSYDSKVFTCSVSYPPSIQIREHAIRMDLESRFSDFYTSETQETMLNKTWKWIIKSKIAQCLSKTFEESDTCSFSINVIMKYTLDSEELQVLVKMDPDYFKKRATQHRKFNGELFSRKGVVDLLSRMRSGVFREHAVVPPAVSQKNVECDSVECNHSSIFFAGRYNKYSRELPQTPWILNGVRQMDSSVQELIFEPIQKFLNISETGLKFSASGREDVDVRCLGRGRPFYVEYLNPKITNISHEQFRRIEREINLSAAVKVRDLQIVSKDELVQIKNGEESKTKEYLALCVSDPQVVKEKLEALNGTAPIKLEQKTPLRVLHRRPLAIREKMIHKLTAVPVTEDPRLFYVYVTTQAGTYVKEFVHGDFGRTKPSIKSILCDDSVDIVALDVTAINLDWPKPVADV